jgi:hypothetical protein
MKKRETNGWLDIRQNLKTGVNLAAFTKVKQVTNQILSHILAHKQISLGRHPGVHERCQIEDSRSI